MKVLQTLLGVALLSLLVLQAPAAAARGLAPAEMAPACMDATVAALRTCVEHAVATGAITNRGIATSLLAKLTAAQAALDRGQPTTAERLLGAFIREVQRQAGRHIEAEHARHMVEHARLVIAALR